jgi:hypothetical protein
MTDDNLEAKTLNTHAHPILETSAYIAGGAAAVTTVLEIGRLAAEYCCELGDAFYEMLLRGCW